MKLFIVSREKRMVGYYKRIIKESGFEYDRDADVVLSLGGDGTYIISENKMPGIPKIMLRDLRCDDESRKKFEKIIEKIKNKNYNTLSYKKIEACYNKEKLVATNDFIIRNRHQQHAVRFRLMVDKKQVEDIIISDGVVACTRWGQTGYYKSITGKTLTSDFGLAINNPHNTSKKDIPLDNYFGEVEVYITRGDAVLSFDNHKKTFILKTGAKIIIKKSKEIAKILIIK